jgi:hypothetical protein
MALPGGSWMISLGSLTIGLSANRPYPETDRLEDGPRARYISNTGFGNPDFVAFAESFGTPDPHPDTRAARSKHLLTSGRDTQPAAAGRQYGSVQRALNSSRRRGSRQGAPASMPRGRSWRPYPLTSHKIDSTVERGEAGRTGETCSHPINLQYQARERTQWPT